MNLPPPPPGAPAGWDPNLAQPGELSPLERAYLQEGRRCSRPVPFPGPLGAKHGVTVVFWTPTDEEIALAQMRATQWLRTELKMDELQIQLALERNVYEAEEQRQLLAVAMRNPGNPEFPLTTVEALRKRLTPDERRVLMRHLAAWLEEDSPEVVLPDDPAELLAKLRELREVPKGPKGEEALPAYLTCCDFGTLRSFVLSLVEALPPPA